MATAEAPAGAGSIVLTGATGQVGWELARALAPLGPVIPVGRCARGHGLDLADADGLRRVVRTLAPALIVNAAAYTAVDRAEDEPERAHAINATAPAILADEAERMGAGLIHYSTDYVFDGGRATAWTEADAPAPINTYGRTKRAGERAVLEAGDRGLVLRTSWVYGQRRHNFLRTMRRLASERDALQIVDDQIASPTWCRLIAETTACIVARLGPTGVAQRGRLFHLAAAGEVSWCGFARAIFAHMAEHEAAPVPAVEPIPTRDYPTPAPRPLYTRLDCTAIERAFGVRMTPWDEALALCLDG